MAEIVKRPISYEESVAILHQFRPEVPPLHGNQIGVRVLVHEVHGKIQPVLQVIVRDRAGETGHVPEVFEYKFEGKSKAIRTSIEVGEPPQAFSGFESSSSPPMVNGCVSAGDYAVGGGGTPGTAGWFFYLDGQLMGIGNWHVFGYQSNTITVEPTNGQCQAKGTVGLSLAVTLDKPVFNFWDLALAEMLQPLDVMAAMKDQSPIPRAIYSNPVPGDGAEYGAIGAGVGAWRYGRLVGVCSTWVGFGAHWGYLAEQLQFDPITTKGDSGSIVIRMDDNSVAGLVFGGDATMTLANPLYKLNWTDLGRTRGNFGEFESP